MKINLSSFSTALFSTWHFIDEWDLLFDAGDGLTAILGSKTRKIRHVFLSHADRDHVTGLLQFMQLNGRPQGLQVYYPKDCGTFPALQEFSRRFDPHILQADWKGISAGDEIGISNDLLVKAVRNEHIPAPPGRQKSFGFIVQRRRRKLREEFAALDGKAIALLRKEKGDDAVMEDARDDLFAYSGDTPVDHDLPWKNVHTLLHEATFVDPADMDPDNPRKNKHSTLQQVMAMVAQTEVKQLVLSHFSSRYDEKQIRKAVENAMKLNQVTIPVELILPGRVTRLCLEI